MSTMNMEEALRIARQQGWTVTKRPTSASSTQQRPAQRQSLVESHNVQPSQHERRFRHGQVIREALHPSNWEALADRTQPLPEGLTPLHALRHMSSFLSYEVSERLGDR